MSDVWRELEERLKQKAKSGFEVVENSTFFTHITGGNICDIAYVCYKCTDKDVCPFMIEKQWVRLEDVQKLIEEIKQKYVLVRKIPSDRREFELDKNAPDRGHLLNSIRSERIEKARQAVCFDCPYYDDCEAGASCFERFLEVLLRDE